ncbi:MAG: OsmC family protein [Cyclobacteriaceae bacterium]|nr:OsmC family protein [Cyclobacteriaceae bacterium]
MAIRRKATAVWNGPGKTGKGTVSTQSGILNKTQYSYMSRFESGTGTNPEELVAAAHAGCFSMKLAFNLQGAGFTATEINTECEIVLEEGTITASNLTLVASVPNISKEKFDELAKDAEQNCPISKLLKTTINLNATLK